MFCKEQRLFVLYVNMNLYRLKNRPALQQEGKAFKKQEKLNTLLAELETRNLPESLSNTINKKVEKLNDLEGSEKELYKAYIKFQHSMIRLLKEEIGIVKKGHYKQMWTALGMSVFGVPLGVGFGTALGNMGFLGIGFPIGMVIGAAVGTKKDKAAAAEGKVLDVEI